MRIIPALDVLKGHVVHGVGGRRENYRPIKSTLSDSTHPVAMADALNRRFGFTDFYVADLDAIAGAEPAFPLFEELRSYGHRLWVDAGVAEIGRGLALADAGVSRVIAGLETLAGPHILAELCQNIGVRTVFSLDLRAGQPLRVDRSWKGEAWGVLEQAVAVGVSSVLVLDLARVGMRSGTGTEELCARLATAYPHVEIIAGGGIHNRADLRRVEQCGVNTVLMATALHDGSVTPADIRNYRSGQLHR